MRRKRWDLSAQGYTLSLIHIYKKSSKEYREIINSMAEKLQIGDKLKSIVKHLTGGERQRVAIIRSIDVYKRQARPPSARSHPPVRAA